MENEKLMHTLMPESVAKRYKEGEESISEEHDNVAVVFAELVGFDAYAQLSGEQELTQLNTLMRGFDEAAERTGVEKVRTLRGGYLASSGLVVPRVDNIRRSVDFARELRTVVSASTPSTAPRSSSAPGWTAAPSPAGWWPHQPGLRPVGGRGQPGLPGANVGGQSGVFVSQPCGTGCRTARLRRSRRRSSCRARRSPCGGWPPMNTFSNHHRWVIASRSAPVALVVLTEVSAGCSRGLPAVGPLRLLRNWVIPVAGLLVLLTFAIQSPADQVWVRVVATVFGLLLILLVLSGFNVALFANARSGSWRERTPKIFIEIARLILIIVGLALLFRFVWGADVGGRRRSGCHLHRHRPRPAERGRRRHLRSAAAVRAALPDR